MDEHELNLFIKASKGDSDSFGLFIKNYEKLIYNASYRMFSNSSDAWDISQEVLIKVYKNLSKCKNPQTFKSWLFRIINNSCIDEIRKRKNKQTISLDKSFEDDGEEIMNQLAVDNNTPLDEYIKKENLGEIEHALSLLDHDHRMLIILRDINGLSYDEIATSLSLSLGTVKSRLSRARLKLKNILISIREQK